MHALVDEREPASNESFPPPVGDPVEEMGAPDTKGARHEPSLNRLVPMEPPRLRPSKTGGGAAERTRNLPSLEPDPSPGHARSRFVPDPGTVLYNDRHADFLLVKDDEGALLDYLSTLVAKEYVVYNNPRATSDDLAEEMVRMLVRVRRHLPRRR
jgi:hypothetical protein